MTTARQIITRAFKELQYFAEGEDPSAAAMADGLDALNSLIASWHNCGLLIAYPPGKTWVGDWAKNTSYAVDQATARNGCTYYCTVAHTSSDNDRPGASPNWSGYWVLFAETPMSLASTFWLDASHDRGVVALLAVEMAPNFNVEPRMLTLQKAREGLNAIHSQYFRVPNAQVDSGLVRMPSSIWPYQIPSVAS